MRQNEHSAGIQGLEGAMEMWMLVPQHLPTWLFQPQVRPCLTLHIRVGCVSWSRVMTDYPVGEHFLNNGRIAKPVSTVLCDSSTHLPKVSEPSGEEITDRSNRK